MAPELHLGDCVQVMAAMSEASADAIVTDPPYGLEFMGKEWDRPWTREDGAGGTSDGFGRVEMADGATRLPRPSYMSSTNPTCCICGGDRRGSLAREMKGRKLCHCAQPEFPNVAAIRGRAFAGWCEQWAREALRVLKPGGHLLAFGGTRTAHRLTCALEDAGFEIRDTLTWLYASGFPKSLDVSKSIDRAAGAERENVGVRRAGIRRIFQGSVSEDEKQIPVTAPATEDAHRWSGWGTALKPAHEPIVLARKPLSEGNVAANVLRWSTGALNVDGCRVGTEENRARPPRTPNAIYGGGNGTNLTASESHPAGRWPANVVLSHLSCEDGCEPDCPVRLLDEQSGFSASPTTRERSPDPPARATWSLGRQGGIQVGHDDSGGASRFFYTAKASRAERNAGLEGMPPRRVGDRQHYEGLPDLRMEREQQRFPTANHHPCVKPVSLMRWLCRLITPKGGTVLDPFMGSGSTGCACALEGFRFVGIEREREYFELARRRIAWWACHPAEELDEAQEDAPAPAQAGQLSLFGMR